MTILKFIASLVLLVGIHTYYSPSAFSMAIECYLKKPPKISVIPSNSLIKYDFTQTKDQLNKVDVDTVSPYGPRHKTSVSGLMSGAISIKSQIAFTQEIYENQGVACTYIQSMDITLHIDPTIFIASEYPKGTCMHNAIMQHELKHVREDQLIINKYANILGRELSSTIDKFRQKYKPVLVSEIPALQQDIQKIIHNDLKEYNQQLNEERQERQQAIDSLEEYESIGKSCSKYKRKRYSYSPHTGHSSSHTH